MGAPEILFHPVLLSILIPSANEQHGVVKLRAAWGAREHARLVGLEDFAVGLDGDGKRLRLEGSLHLGRGRLSDALVGADCSISLFYVVIFAAEFHQATVARGVGVVALHDSIVTIHVVLIGIGLLTTVAALADVPVAGVGAVDELLLGENEELFRGDKVGTLDWASLAEGPAWAALALVLHRCDGSGTNPVGVSIPIGLVEVVRCLLSSSLT